MNQGTIIRDDNIWQGHPDVALFKDRLYVVYRQSDSHVTETATSIQLMGGDPPEFGWPDPFLRIPVTIAETTDRLNCPRLSVIGDELWIICDEVDQSSFYIKAENDEMKTRVRLWKSSNGTEWEEVTTNITGIVPDRICQTNDGFLIATHTSHEFSKEEKSAEEQLSEVQSLDWLPYSKSSRCLVQNIWSSQSMSGPWEKHPLAHLEDHNLCEASVCHDGKRFICLMRENSGKGLPAFMALSKDGINWSGLKQTRMFGCHRPVTGFLKSGNLLTTYREASHSFKRGYWAKNTFACLTHPKSIKTGCGKSIILPLDHDNSRQSDSGYTGWVQFEDETIFIVNYFTGDAPKPYIRWYTIHEGEF